MDHPNGIPMIIYVIRRLFFGRFSQCRAYGDQHVHVLRAAKAQTGAYWSTIQADRLDGR